MKFLFLWRTHGSHYIVFLCNKMLLHQKDGSRTEYYYYRKSTCQVGISADLTHVLIIYKNRKYHITFADEHWSTKVCQTGHKYHNGTGCNRRKDYRQCNGPQSAKLVTSQVLCSLFQTGVDASHSTGGIQINIREQLKSKYQDDTQFSVNTWKMDTKLGKHICHQTRTSKQHDPAVGADKWRAHKAHDDKNMDELLAPYIITGHYIGNGNTYNQCGDRCYHRYKNTSSQCGIIIFLCEKSDIVLKGKAVHLG